MSDLQGTLDDPSLCREEAYIDGSWVSADSGRRFNVDNPATGGVIATVADLGSDETKQAIAAAARAFEGWRATSAQERASCLRRWTDEILRNREDLARIVS